MKLTKNLIAVLIGAGVFILLGIFGVLIALLVAAGGSDEEPKAAEPTTTQTSEAPSPSLPVPETEDPAPPAPTSGPSSIDEAFLQLVREQGITGTDEELLSQAKEVCELFDGGATIKDFQDQVLDSGMTPEEAHDFGFFVGASVAAYCPEHTSKVTGGASA